MKTVLEGGKEREKKNKREKRKFSLEIDQRIAQKRLKRKSGSVILKYSGECRGGNEFWFWIL